MSSFDAYPYMAREKTIAVIFLQWMEDSATKAGWSDCKSKHLRRVYQSNAHVWRQEKATYFSKYSKFHSMIEPLLSPSSNQKDKWQEGSAVIGHSKGLTKYNTEESISKIEKK